MDLAEESHNTGRVPEPAWDSFVAFVATLKNLNDKIYFDLFNTFLVTI